MNSKFAKNDSGSTWAAKDYPDSPDLLRAGECFLAIAATTHDMIHLNDLEGRVVYANQATETLLGYALNEFINTHAFEIIHPDDREHIKNDMQSISPDNQLPARDIRLLKKDGSYLAVEVRGFIVAGCDENKYVGAIIRDISRREKTESDLATYRNSLEKLVQERTWKLEKALAEIKILKGILPICMHCKNIRNDDGIWHQIEQYIHENSEAKFTHCICPSCRKEHYPELQE